MMGLSPSGRLVTMLGVLCLPALPALAQYTPVWSDEFIGTTLDLTNWEYMLGDGSDYGMAGWGNNEWQYYTSRPENVYVSGGALHIVARKESYAGASYTSARLRSLHKRDFLYGRIEARMKVPSGKGLWPAFWMLPTDSPYGGWAASGEIDILETVNVATTIYGTIHYGGSWPNNVHTGGSYSSATDFGLGFHTYALEWEPDVMRWYVDGLLYHTETSSTWYSTAAPNNARAPFDTPFHLLLNVAVGGNWPGYPDDSTVFPQELIVDWVRVSQLPPSPSQSPYGGVPATVPGKIEAEDFDLGAEGEAYHDCDANNQGGKYRTNVGVDIEDCAAGGYNIGWMCGGEWLEYTINAMYSGPYIIELRTSSQTAGGLCHLEFDGVNGTGNIVAPVTGGWQSWASVWARAELAVGEQVMRFANDPAAANYNLNYIRLYSAADFNRNGVLSVDDLAGVCTCVAGPGVTTPPAGCTPDAFARADLDGDGDVDVHDLDAFQRASAW